VSDETKAAASTTESAVPQPGPASRRPRTAASAAAPDEPAVTLADATEVVAPPAPPVDRLTVKIVHGSYQSERLVLEGETVTLDASEAERLLVLKVAKRVE
jgi:hypothetical protein